MVSNVVENILNDWNSESSCNSEIGKNKEILSTKTENKNGRQKSSDDEGFSSSSATFLDLKKCSEKKVEREACLRTSTPNKNSVPTSEENVVLTPIPSCAKTDIDKKFFENLLSIHNCSQTKIIIKDKFTITEDVDATTETNQINKKQAPIDLPRRKSGRIRKSPVRRWSTVYVSDKKFYNTLTKPCNVSLIKKRKRKSMAVSAANNTENSRYSQNSVTGTKQRRKLYSEVNWLSSLRSEDSNIS